MTDIRNVSPMVKRQIYSIKFLPALLTDRNWTSILNRNDREAYKNI